MKVGRGKVSSKGWVVIPKDIRDAMGLAPGDEVHFVLFPPAPGWKQDKEFSKLTMTRMPEDPVAAFTGMRKRRRGEPYWTDEIVEEHKRELEREEREIRALKRRRKTSA